jgi:hypothetical protein
MEKEKGKRLLLFLLYIPIFISAGYFFDKTYGPRNYDFAAYWQAAHMVSKGGDVYDSNEWLSVREKEQTALHSEITFQYPLPLAILMVPLGLLPVGHAYIIWLLLMQIAILTSILLLLRLQSITTWPHFFEIAIIAFLFLFRPTYVAILNGQISAIFLLFTTIGVFAFRRKQWFVGGLLISVLSLKPTIGLPILGILGLWLLAQKSWLGILGMVTGAIILFSIGALYQPSWVLDYLSAGQHLLTRYLGKHSTLLGITTLFFEERWFSFVLAGLGTGAILLVVIRLFFFKRIENPFAVMAAALASGLLIAPYSWPYDQLLLIVTMLFIMNEICKRYGFLAGFLLILMVIVISILLVLLAHQLGHDVWSVLVTLLLWGVAVYFANSEKTSSLHKLV